jgi:hypothetical protein
VALFANWALIAARPLVCSIVTASVYDGVPPEPTAELEDPGSVAVFDVVAGVTAVVVIGLEPDPPGRHCEYQALE